MNKTPLYLGSVKDAIEAGELELWRNSFRANEACANAIQTEISKCYDGAYLDTSCVGKVVKRFGQERVQFVLANTLRELDYDGRFSQRNMDWGQRINVPPDKRHNCSFIVNTHPAILDGFISAFRKEYPEPQQAVDFQQIEG